MTSFSAVIRNLLGNHKPETYVELVYIITCGDHIVLINLDYFTCQYNYTAACIDTAALPALSVGESQTNCQNHCLSAYVISNNRNDVRSTWRVRACVYACIVVCNSS